MSKFHGVFPYVFIFPPNWSFTSHLYAARQLSAPIMSLKWLLTLSRTLSELLSVLSSEPLRAPLLTPCYSAPRSIKAAAGITRATRHLVLGPSSLVLGTFGGLGTLAYLNLGPVNMGLVIWTCIPT